MISIEELIREVSSIKMTSEQLSQMTGMAGEALAHSGTEITALVRGSNTGMEAVMAVNIAARSLGSAAASMRQLGHICDSCIANLSK